MKEVNYVAKYDASKFMGKTNNFLEAQLLYSAIELDLFKKLKLPITAKDLSKITGYNLKNLELFLNALTAIKFLEKKDNKFSNLPDCDYYLNPDSEMYLGEHILYWKDMTSLENIKDLIKKGPEKLDFEDKNGSDFFDFRSMGQGSRNTMYLGRVQNFISIIKEYFKQEEEFKVFDMGGGSGIMSVEIARTFPGSKVVIFDQAPVIEITKEVIEEYKVSSQVKTKVGNFVLDSFEDTYDLIIASGVLDFVGDLDKMVSKLKKSLKEGGYIYVNTHGINEEFTGPKKFILGWLSSHLNGLDILKPDPVIRESFKKQGFEIIFADKSGLNFIARKIII